MSLKGLSSRQLVTFAKHVFVQEQRAELLEQYLFRGSTWMSKDLKDWDISTLREKLDISIMSASMSPEQAVKAAKIKKAMVQRRAVTEGSG